MWLLNARVIGATDVNETERVNLQFDESNQLTEIQSHQPPDGPSLDLKGDFLSLGGMDLQINGALGVPFPELKADQKSQQQLVKIGRFLWQQGVNAYAPTLVTTSVDNFQNALQSLANYALVEHENECAEILGAHLEGPCLNPQKRGAHPAQFLQPLTLATLESVMGPHLDQVAIVTLAPELDSTHQVIRSLKSQSPATVVSLGHSLATDQDAAEAFAAGATMVTHAFNAMPPLHHRQPGLLAVALTTPQVWSGFIADGQHVSPRMLKLLIQAAPDGLFLVSDALSPLGLPDGDYPWDDRTITVTHGTARLPDGTLSGTTRSLLDGVKNLVQWGCCTPEKAIALATDAPRRAMGRPGIQLGTPLHHFLRWTYSPAHKQLTWERLG